MIVAQLSDPHIVTVGELLYGRVDTAQFLARAVAEINRLDPLPDVVVVTGDLVDHGAPAEYEHLRALLAPLRMPLFVIPGITTPASRCARLSAPMATCLPRGSCSSRSKTSRFASSRLTPYCQATIAVCCAASASAGSKQRWSRRTSGRLSC